MNPMKDWESIQPVYEKAILPPGGYILKLCSAKEIRYEDQQASYSKLEFCFDIDQGNYAGFYEKDYQSQIQMPKKWHGVLRQVLPQEDGSDQDIWRKSRLKSLIQAIEESNEDYVWDWDESSLKEKIVGGLFRREEWESNGRNGWTTRCFRFVPASVIAAGGFLVPKDRPLRRIQGK